MSLCTTCNGTGSLNELENCFNCGGSGSIYEEFYEDPYAYDPYYDSPHYEDYEPNPYDGTYSEE